MKNELLNNIDKIHTTELGIARIKCNLELKENDIVNWCKNEILKSKEIYKKGKNWYVNSQGKTITINGNSYTIITAHKNDHV